MVRMERKDWLTPWEQGFDAGVAGKTEADNPFPYVDGSPYEGPTENEQWSEGLVIGKLRKLRDDYAALEAERDELAADYAQQVYKVNELEAKVERLTGRGFEDLTHENSDLRAQLAQRDAVIAEVRKIVHGNTYIEAPERDELLAILADTPKVLAVVDEQVFMGSPGCTMDSGLVISKPQGNMIHVDIGEAGEVGQPVRVIVLRRDGEIGGE